MQVTYSIAGATVGRQMFTIIASPDKRRDSLRHLAIGSPEANGGSLPEAKNRERHTKERRCDSNRSGRRSGIWVRQTRPRSPFLISWLSYENQPVTAVGVDLPRLCAQRCSLRFPECLSAKFTRPYVAIDSLVCALSSIRTHPPLFSRYDTQRLNDSPCFRAAADQWRRDERPWLTIEPATSALQRSQRTLTCERTPSRTKIQRWSYEWYLESVLCIYHTLLFRAYRSSSF